MENMNFVAIDLETATCERDSICEIGLAVVLDAKIVESRSWLIKPIGNRYDEFNISIHGITPDMTVQSPSFINAWKEIEPYLNNHTVVAHNTSFDMYALKEAFESNRIPFPTFEYYCSLRIARKVFNNRGIYSFSLPIVCAALGIEFPRHHRAEGDAIGCAKVFMKCLEEINVASFNDLQEKLNFTNGYFTQGVHQPQLSKSISSNKNLLKDIVADESKFDNGNYFYKKAVCFTGTFMYGARRELLQKVADIGGVPMNSVTKKTDVLVVGQQDYRVVGDSGLSGKQKKAMDMISKGVDMEIMSEVEFLNNF